MNPSSRRFLVAALAAALPAAARADPPRSVVAAASAPSVAPTPEPTAHPAPPPGKAPPKPLVATVLAGVKRVPGYAKVKAYETPPVEPDPPLEPTAVKTLEVTDDNEVLVLQHPTLSPLLGAVVHGARVAVKGAVHPRSMRGCAGNVWYALEPAGYVCSKGVRPTTQPPTTAPVLEALPGDVLPYHYVVVGLKEGEKTPLWDSLEHAEEGAPPERQLERGDSVAVFRTVRIDGVSHHVSVEGKVLATRGTYPLGSASTWQGEVLDDKTVFPFGWTTPESAKVYGEPSTKQKPIDVVARRVKLPILEEQGDGSKRMLRVGDGRWLRAVDVNEVRRIPRPDGITAATQWVDVDLGEQVLVAYEGDQPVYATLTSSGRAIQTPRGNYPVWAKVSSISMKSQPYEDKGYFVNKVPWVLFFQAHNAIHGAYWHDRFGVSKSHGCVNVSPLDARHLFDWMKPALPPGWTGYRAPDLLASPTVHVRNSHAKVELVQERPIGPPDKELEAQKMEQAEARRAAATVAGTPPLGMAP